MEGRKLLVEALEESRRSHDQFFDGEVCRTMAKFCEDPLEAAALLRKAQEIARHQGAFSFELRAATALYRLSKSAPGAIDGSQAREELVRIHASFHEGRETPDLVLATRLLNEPVE